MSKKKFLTIDEQLKHLENNRKLLFISNDEKEVFKKYLINYNYEIIINNYTCEYFFKSQDKYTFINNLSSNLIIDIFELDKSISLHILKVILEIERRISTSIVYSIPNIFKNKSDNNKNKYPEELIKKINNGLIYELSDEEWNIIFPNSNEKDKLTKDFLVKYCFNNNKLVNDLKKKYGTIQNVPIWSLSYYWTLNTVKHVYKSVDISTKRQIIYFLFNNNEKINADEFLIILDILNLLRNRICHNNMIYNFRYNDQFFKFKKGNRNNKDKNKDIPRAKNIIKRNFNKKISNVIFIKDVLDLISLFKIENVNILIEDIKNELSKLDQKIENREKLFYSKNKVKLKDINVFKSIKKHIL